MGIECGQENVAEIQVSCFSFVENYEYLIETGVLL